MCIGGCYRGGERLVHGLPTHTVLHGALLVARHVPTALAPRRYRMSHRYRSTFTLSVGLLTVLTQLALAADFTPARAAVYFSPKALVGFQGRGCADGVQPDLCHFLFLEALIFQ